MPVRAQKALLASLLVLQDFDFSQVLAKLMDIVGSLGHVRPDLTSEQKQRIVAKAREREKYLWEQLKQVRGELDELLDLGSVKGRTLRQRLTRYSSRRTRCARWPWRRRGSVCWTCTG
jgi:ATP-dependent Lon protease